MEGEQGAAPAVAPRVRVIPRRRLGLAACSRCVNGILVAGIGAAGESFGGFFAPQAKQLGVYLRRRRKSWVLFHPFCTICAVHRA
eukprot:840678-Prymnesium_polylepis.1